MNCFHSECIIHSITARTQKIYRYCFACKSSPIDWPLYKQTMMST